MSGHVVGHGGYEQRSPRDFSMLMGASPKIVGWAATTSSAGVNQQPNNKTGMTGSLNICSQDMKKVGVLRDISFPL
jgi:hypothetical protein